MYRPSQEDTGTNFSGASVGLFFMTLSSVNKRAEQTVLMLTYKYVVVGRGGHGAIIVSGSKHACLIISCNIPIFVLPISLLLTKSQKYTISFATQGKTYPVPETLMQASAFLVGSRVRFTTEMILSVLKNPLSLQF